MAVLYVSEFKDMPVLNTAGVIPQCPQAPGLAEQNIAIGGASVASAAFNASTAFIMIHTDAICALAFSESGSAATAVATAHRVAANETRFYGVRPGGKISVITAT